MKSNKTRIEITKQRDSFCSNRAFENKRNKTAIFRLRTSGGDALKAAQIENLEVGFCYD